MNAATGEVLASHNANESVPIASITKLMTVLIALQHLKPSDIVTVTGYAAQVGESRIPLCTGRAHHRPRPARGRAHPEREQRRGCACVRGLGRRHSALRRLDERTRARARAARHAFRASGRARRARARVERARRRRARAGGDALADRARARAPANGHDRGRRRSSCTPGTTCSASSPASSVSRRATRTTPAGVRSRQRAAPATRSTR